MFVQRKESARQRFPDFGGLPGRRAASKRICTNRRFLMDLLMRISCRLLF
ncbi:MAG: hypothetical protein KatS3mg052_2558 [Candidatus Roseilinea sp.]|nr:MAG: hypothetical protein KatS3mg052_2558 [Candidatus Roseilinea sp.]